MEENRCVQNVQKNMASRTFDIILKCGCMISLDSGGALIPCCYGYGCGKKGCEYNNLCDSCIEQEKKCQEAWDEYKKSKKYKIHQKEIKERNN